VEFVIGSFVFVPQDTGSDIVQAWNVILQHTRIAGKHFAISARPDCLTTNICESKFSLGLTCNKQPRVLINFTFPSRNDAGSKRLLNIWRRSCFAIDSMRRGFAFQDLAKRSCLKRKIKSFEMDVWLIADSRYCMIEMLTAVEEPWKRSSHRAGRGVGRLIDKHCLVTSALGKTLLHCHSQRLSSCPSTSRKATQCSPVRCTKVALISCDLVTVRVHLLRLLSAQAAY
jgi:hypothetical protein